MVVARLDPHPAGRSLDAHLPAPDDTMKSAFVPGIREIAAVDPKPLGRRLEVVRCGKREQAHRGAGTRHGAVLAASERPTSWKSCERLEGRTARREPGGEPGAGEDAVGRERGTAIGDTVADVDEWTAVGESDALTRLTADGTGLALEEDGSPTGRQPARPCWRRRRS